MEEEAAPETGTVDMSCRGEWSRILESIKERPRTLKSLDPALLADKDFVIAAIVAAGWGSHALMYVDPKLKADPEVVLKVAEIDVGSLQFADSTLMADPDFVRQIWPLDPHHGGWQMWDFVDRSLLSNRAFMLDAVSYNGKVLKFANAMLQADREVVLAAVRNSGDIKCYGGEPISALRYADPVLRADREVVLAAVAVHGEHLQYADDSLKGDRELVLQAVRQGFYLQNLPGGSALLSDRDLVLEAVTKDGDNLRYADAVFCADREVVLAAARSKSSCIHYASEELRDSDPEISQLWNAAHDAFMK